VLAELLRYDGRIDLWVFTSFFVGLGWSLPFSSTALLCPFSFIFLRRSDLICSLICEVFFVFSSMNDGLTCFFLELAWGCYALLEQLYEEERKVIQM
jgi:hypothetical protein